MIPAAPILGVLRAVPVWAWALAAVLAWGAFQKHRATSATQKAAEAQQAAAVHAAAAAEQAKAREIEHQLSTRAKEAADVYQANLAAARSRERGARTELERLRIAIANDAAGSCSAAPGASAPGRADAAPPVHAVLGSCASALQELAGIADEDATRLKALQDYVIAIGAASAPQPRKDQP